MNKLYLPHIIALSDQIAINTKKIEFSVEYMDENAFYVQINKEMEIKVPKESFLYQSTEKTDIDKIIKYLTFQIEHAFFHYTEDSNYTILHWALYFSLKNYYVLVHQDEKSSIKTKIKMLLQKIENFIPV